MAVLLAALLLVRLSNPPPGPPRPLVPAPAYFKAREVARFPHDTSAYTQGLLIHEGHLYESTGQYGESTVRQIDLLTGRVLDQVKLERTYFAEGLAWHREQLFQLTWRENKVFLYAPNPLTCTGTLTNPGEAWGLASNGTDLFLTDGSNAIRVLDDTFRTQRGIVVRDNNGPVSRLNEIEWYDGALLINVWQTDLIARVDPATGHVLAWIDCSNLLPAAERTPRTDVLNGIACDAAHSRLYVTGKYWPLLFQIELDPAQ